MNEHVDLERRIEEYITLNYDTNIVKFHPNLYRMMLDRKTGFLQIVGSEVDGKLVYHDENHLTTYGSLRYMHYFRDKIFSKAS